jgi:succinyldiaminopimelate transaminase
MTAGFVPPPYPYDRLDPLRAVADELPGGAVDLSVGTPMDPPPAAVVAALVESDAARPYPPSIGTVPFREAAAGWIERRFGVGLSVDQVAACVGTKEFVASVPGLLRLRRPDRDTVLYPAVSYPTYAMGATLSGCRAVPVAVDDRWRMDLTAIDAADLDRAVCLWVNTPGNPAGALDDLAAAAAFGRAHDIPVLSDECYAEFTWSGEPRTVLAAGLDGVLAVHSLSKRSNLAGLRVGCYAGDGDLVGYLREVRKHAGLMVAGPAQAAAVVAWSDQDHVAEQRVRYEERLSLAAAAFGSAGLDVSLPDGAFYLWVEAPGGDAWALTTRLAEQAGAIVSPGEFYGAPGQGHVRVAVVQPDDRLRLVADRLAA